MNEVRKLLESRYPGLHARIEQTLVASEARFNAQAGNTASQFLLEHSRHTAAIAHTLAVREREAPLLPVLVALFHDSGKFHDGGYHQDDVPEEEHAARIAQPLLREWNVDREVVDAVATALRCLYHDRLDGGAAARIVQDADRLDKLGALGVGAFFTKATLRGRGLVDSLTHTLSRELTYAMAAPRSMLTEAGRALAREQAARTISFFDDLLAELESCGIAAFDRRTLEIAGDFRTVDGAPSRKMQVIVVTPRGCPDCEAAIALTHRLERGVKCETLKAQLTCKACDYSREIAFCLPVFA